MSKATFTKKHYKAIAKIISERYDIFIEDEYGILTGLIQDLADYFQSDNPRFDREEFISACCEASNKSYEAYHKKRMLSVEEETEEETKKWEREKYGWERE